MTPQKTLLALLSDAGIVRTRLLANGTADTLPCPALLLFFEISRQ